MDLSVKKIADAVRGYAKYKHYGVKISGVATDSRADDLSGKLFIPIVGERFDGHEFIREAVYKGAVCVMSEKTLDTSHPVITVDSTRGALCDLAAYYRSSFDIQVVAITGSVGKTTTKDMVAQVLSAKYKTLKSEGNFNNEIGLPLTIFKLDDSYQAAVLEFGMNSAGEIRRLSAIARPTVGIITNIGVAHIEQLKSREGILKAKTEMFEFLSEQGHIVLNGDDDLLKTIRSDRNEIHYFGKNPDNYYNAFNIKSNGLIGVSCIIKYGGRQFKLNIPVPGEHMVENALAAVAAGDILGLSEANIKNGLESIKPLKMRMDILGAPGGKTVINDAYNANPVSMKAGIDVLADVGSRKVCVLGDMLELGHSSDAYHYEVGAYAAAKGIDLIICVGAASKHIHAGVTENIQEGISCLYYSDQERLIADINDLTCEGDTILIKASRGMQLEKTVAQLMDGGSV